MGRDSDLLRSASTSGPSLRQNATMIVPTPVLLLLPIDPTLCPLCGESNVCAMEIERQSGIAQAPCWCMSAVFSESLQEQIPDAARGQACICARCVAKAATLPTS